jgi:hypothetical protein
MPVQELKKAQNYRPAIAEFGHSATITFIPHANLQASWPVTTGVNAQTTDIRAAQTQALSSLAEHLAVWLARTLDVLRGYDEQAIYPIMSILEPYMEETPDIDFPFPPKSSRDVTIKVTNRGRVTPTLFIEDVL